MSILHHRSISLLAAASALLLSGCIEESTVIKVNRDGSGIIHERSYSASTDDVISLPGLSGSDEDKKKPEKEEPKLPTETDLKAAHSNGNLITLFNADLGKMLENEGGMAAMDKFEHVDRSTFQSMADQLDGLDIDLQDPIVVEIK